MGASFFVKERTNDPLSWPDRVRMQRRVPMNALEKKRKQIVEVQTSLDRTVTRTASAGPAPVFRAHAAAAVVRNLSAAESVRGPFSSSRNTQYLVRVFLVAPLAIHTPGRRPRSTSRRSPTDGCGKNRKEAYDRLARCGRLPSRMTRFSYHSAPVKVKHLQCVALRPARFPHSPYAPNTRASADRRPMTKSPAP